MLTTAQKLEAIQWYAQGFSMSTIAQHYGLTFEEIASQLNNV